MITKEQESKMNNYYLELTQNGSINTLNEAMIFKLSYEKSFSLQSFMPEFLLCKETHRSFNITEGKKYKLMKKEGNVCTIIDDLGNEDNYNEDWFKKL